MKEIFRYTLADQGDELVAYAKQRVEALRSCRVPASEVVLATCKRKSSNTGQDRGRGFHQRLQQTRQLVQVRVAKQRINGLGFTTGMKVSVVTDASKPPMAAVHWPTPRKSRAGSDTTGDFTPSDWQQPWANHGGLRLGGKGPHGGASKRFVLVLDRPYEEALLMNEPPHTTMGRHSRTLMVVGLMLCSSLAGCIFENGSTARTLKCWRCSVSVRARTSRLAPPSVLCFNAQRRLVGLHWNFGRKARLTLTLQV